jgi:hypothetical protein
MAKPIGKRLPFCHNGKGMAVMDGDRARTVDESTIAYAYRPSLLGAAWEFALTDTGIEWVAGSRSGRMAFRNIRVVRMSYKPASMQSRRFVTEIWADGAPKLQIVSVSWKSMVEQERRDRPYSAFIRELHRRLALSAPQARFEQGTNPLKYWPGLIVFVIVALLLAGLTARGLQADTWRGAAIVGVFLALFLWQGGKYFRCNRPGSYRPDALPAEVMPKG